MRTAFLCSGLEPGRDGVGDYTRGLAEELARQGHAVTIIALNDPDVAEFTETPGESGLSTLRLPRGSPWASRLEAAADQLNRFNPEWISLQFVCYGFHPKGLVFGLADKLAPLLAEKKVQIMFHETWLCRELGWGWAKRAVGWLQLFSIRRFVRRIRPNRVHTSNPVYVALLRRNKIPARELSLFGNVPVRPASNFAWIQAQISGALGNEFQRENRWLFGIYGSLHPQWPPEPLLSYLQKASKLARKRPVILSIGRIGNGGLLLWDKIVRGYAHAFDFVRLGEQSADRISEALSFLDFGIAMTPRATLGKSGTVVSMLEHGLPVIVNRDDAAAIGDPAPSDNPLLLPCDPSLERRLQGRISKGQPQSLRPLVAQRFVEAMEQAAA